MSSPISAVGQCSLSLTKKGCHVTCILTSSDEVCKWPGMVAHAFCPSTQKAEGPKLLPKYQVKSFLTPCCSLEIPMDFRLYKSVVVGLIDLLGARWYFASKVLTPYCYTIDIEIKLDEEGFVLPFTVDEDVHKRVALCIDGPKRFCYESTHLLGKEVIKRRHLQLLGYQVVQVPYHEVEVLRSRLELVEYLQRKLFSQNSIVRW